MRQLVLLLTLVTMSVGSAFGESDLSIRFLSDRDGERYAHYLMNEDGTDVRAITFEESAHFMRAADPYNIHQETPQGVRILRSTLTENGRLDDIAIFDEHGEIIERLTDNDFFNQAPKWSPDGSKTLFSSNRERLGSFDVFVMNRDGTNLVKVSGDGGGWGEWWSPDGGRIVFSGTLSEGTVETQLFTVDPDGNNLVQLTNLNGHAYGPKWSPDGRRIAFSLSTTTPRSSDIYVVNPDGTGLLNLTDHSAEEIRFDWAPDGRRIAFDSDRNGNPDIYLVNVDGSGLTNLSNNAAEDLAPTWGPDNETLRGPLTAIGAEGGARPSSFSLEQNHPNPFNSETVFRFELPDELDIESTVYSLLGQEMFDLLVGTMQAGVHELRWNGKDASGAEIGSGVYFYRLQAGEQSVTHKMLMLR